MNSQGKQNAYFENCVQRWINNEVHHMWNRSYTGMKRPLWIIKVYSYDSISARHGSILEDSKGYWSKEEASWSKGKVNFEKIALEWKISGLIKPKVTEVKIQYTIDSVKDKLDMFL